MIHGQPISAAVVGGGAPQGGSDKPGKGNVKPGRSGTTATTSALGDQLVTVRKP